MVLNNGILDVQKLMAGDAAGKPFTEIAIGTGNAAVTGTETSLTGQVVKTISSYNYLSDSTGYYIQFNATYGPSDPTITIQEMGLVNSGGVLVYRLVIAPVTMVNGVTYTLSYKIKVQ